MKVLALCMAATLAFGCGSVAARDPLKVGDRAPRETASDQDGKAVDLQELYKRGLVLIYFYPKADTPGCTAQACSLRDAYEELTEAGVKVIGVSADGADDQRAFKEKYSLPFTLIADRKGDLARAFRVPTIFGKAHRQAFLIKDGVIVWYDASASTKKQAEDVLEVLKTLK